MTRKSKRDLEKRLEEIEGDGQPAEWDTESDIVTITDTMVDDSADVIEEKVPHTEAPDGYERGDVVPTESPVVTVRELVPENSDDE